MLIHMNIQITDICYLFQYWLCEHTTILQPRNPNAIPRCVKWDLTALHSNMKSITLAKLGLNEVEVQPNILCLFT